MAWRAFSGTRPPCSRCKQITTGCVDRRLRSADGQTEVHLVSFPSADHFESYRNDPRPAKQSHLLDEAHARLELYELIDVA